MIFLPIVYEMKISSKDYSQWKRYKQSYNVNYNLLQ